MAADVTIFAALFAGLLSFLSPCVLPLVPPYLVYLAGSSLERLADAEPEPRLRRETVLAAILAVAASEQTVARGAGLLAVYSLGLGIPFLLAAFAVEPFAAFLTRFRRHLAKVERVMGGLLVLTGIAFLTGFVSQASFWLLEMFPALGTIG